MSRHLIVLLSAAHRQRAARYIAEAPSGTRVEFKVAKRSLPQNDRLWAMLTDISKQKEHCGRKYTPDIWKCLMMHACGRTMQFVPALDNSTVMPLGYRSSDLGKSEMSDLIEFMFAWGAENGVVFQEKADAERVA